MSTDPDAADAAEGDGWDDDDSGGWDADDDAFEAVADSSAVAADQASQQIQQQPEQPPPPTPGAEHTPELSRPTVSTSNTSLATPETPYYTPTAAAAASGGGGDGDGDDQRGHSYSSSYGGGSQRGGSSSGGIFFADAMLDLDEAHDLAETPVPEPRRAVVFAEEVGSLPLSGAGGAEGGGVGSVPALPNMGVAEREGIVHQGEGTNGGLAMQTLGSRQTVNANDTDQQSSIPVATIPTMTSLSNVTSATATATASANAANNNDTNTSSAQTPAQLGPTKNSNGRFEADTPAAVPRPIGPSGPALDRPMASASSAPTSLASLQPTYRPKRPNRPRDLRWATAALTFIPLSLTLPFALQKALSADEGPQSSWEIAATSTQGHTATVLSSSFAFASTFIIGRLLYRTVGGGDGDEDRHRAADYMILAAPVAVVVLPVSALVVLLATPGAFWPYGFLPLLFFVKDVLTMRAGMAGPDVPVPSELRRHRSAGGAGSSEGGRRTFFMALSGTALDILSRSLRRQSFYRFVTAALGVQFVVILLWRDALFRALSVSHTVVGKVLVLLVLLGGKWATGLVSRMLSLVASGGVTSWFAQQSLLIDEMERIKEARRQEEEAEQTRRVAAAASATASTPVAPNDSVGAASENYEDGLGSADVAANASARAAARAALHSMPEAYRTADASIYSPVIDFDEGYDDDFEDEDEEDMFVGGGGGGGRSGGARGLGDRTSSWTGGGSGGRSTVKSFVVSGATVSFGSVAQCGLLGGPAQFVWSVLRNADALGVAMTRRFSSSAARFGFRGMSVSAWDGDDESMGGGGNGDWRQGAMSLYGRFDFIARQFVRGHSDLAMSHVAAYFKSYQRAANDVAALIDASGVEPIIHDDITTRMCAAVGTAISSIICIFIGYIVAHHRGMSDPSASLLSDRAVCEIMFLCFIFSYTIIFTIMEPLRASIKAVYVCFAQHPQSLSQAFPLIFHRLTRISEANMVV